MALKRLDEEFDLKPGTQLLPYMQRLLPSLEGRFQALESERKTFDMAVTDMQAVALKRINEILIPATEDIIKVTTLGFLLGPSTSSVFLELGLKTFTVTEGPQRTSFTPSPYVLIERTVNADDYAIARVLDYDNVTGALILNLTAVHGDPGPWHDWVISSTPGMADSTKLYHDEVGPMRDEVAADTVEVRAARDEIIAAANALFASGLDVQAFIRRDGAVPFVALQIGVHPPAGANDAYLATTAWARARMIEYANVKLNRAGDTMGGALTLSGPPTQALHAATKAYVDAIIGQGGTVTGILNIQAVNPTLKLQSTGTGQHRMIDTRSPAGLPRWVLSIGDTAPETGGNVGSNFSVLRYNDGGSYVGTPFTINRSDGSAVFGPGGVTVQAGINCTALTVSGDVHVYRPGGSTGVVYLNQSNSAYHYFDGATHVLAGGGLSTGAVGCGGITCTTINTQGNGITVGGITNTGNMTANGAATVGALQINSTANYITLYDTDWGVMYLHHNGDLCGFLNNGGGWAMYVTNAGHIWSTQYGYLHDYVNNAASNYAWSAANSKDGAINNAQGTANDAWNRANNAQGSANNAQGTANDAWNRANNAQNSANNAQGTANYAVSLASGQVSDMRMPYAGDIGVPQSGTGVREPWNGGVVTGIYGGELFNNDNGNIIISFLNGARFRIMQYVLSGQWYTVRYE